MRKAEMAALAGLLLAAAAPIEAQQLTAGRFTVTPVLGTIRWDNASALANKEADDETGAFTRSVFTPTVGLSVDYLLWRQLGLGFYFEAARPTTRGDYFPAVLFNFGPGVPAQLSVVSQRVTVLMYGVQGTFGFGVGRLEPYVGAGLGAVTVNGDPQQNGGNVRFTNGMFQVGGGLGFRVGANTSVRLDLRDHVFTGWDRDRLYPVQSAFQNTQFPAANPTPPAEKSTVHNIRLAIGFSYVPARAGAGTDASNEERE